MGSNCLYCDAELGLGMTACPKCRRPILLPESEESLELDLPAAPVAPPPPPAPTTVECPSCSFQLAPGLRECPRCGVILAKARRPGQAAAAPPPAMDLPAAGPVAPMVTFGDDAAGSPYLKEARLYLLDWGLLSLLVLAIAPPGSHAIKAIPSIGIGLATTWGLSIAGRLAYGWFKEQTPGIPLILILVFCGWNWAFSALVATGISFVNRAIHDLAPRVFAWRPTLAATAVMLTVALGMGVRAEKVHSALPSLAASDLANSTWDGKASGPERAEPFVLVLEEAGDGKLKGHLDYENGLHLAVEGTYADNTLELEDTAVLSGEGAPPHDRIKVLVSKGQMAGTHRSGAASLTATRRP